MTDDGSGYDGSAMVVYREVDGNIEYLMLHKSSNWTGWEIPKGSIEYGNSLATAYLELDEEASIRPTEAEISELGRDLRWELEDGEYRCFKAYLVEISADTEVSTERNPHPEHDETRFASYREAQKKLEYEEQRELIRAAEEKIRQ